MEFAREWPDFEALGGVGFNVIEVDLVPPPELGHLDFRLHVALASSDIEDVIDRANNSPYGLGGSVWSADEDKAIDIAGRIESGTVWVNQHVAISPVAPMAGAKQSGIGVEQDQEGLNEYSQIQLVNVARSNHMGA